MPEGVRAAGGRAAVRRIGGVAHAGVWHRRAAVPEFVNIKAGSLDEPIDIGDAVHIWTSRKFPGVVIPAAARCCETEPTR